MLAEEKRDEVLLEYEVAVEAAQNNHFESFEVANIRCSYETKFIQVAARVQ
jgi:hypothetical protein